MLKAEFSLFSVSIFLKGVFDLFFSKSKEDVEKDKGRQPTEPKCGPIPHYWSYPSCNNRNFAVCFASISSPPLAQGLSLVLPLFS